MQYLSVITKCRTPSDGASFIYIIENVDLMLEMKLIVKIFSNIKYAFSHEKWEEISLFYFKGS